MAKKEKKHKPGSKGALKDKQEKEEAKAGAAPPFVPYTDPDIVMWSIAIVDSYYRVTGKPLFPEKTELTAAAKKLWEAPFACMSHGTEDDPIFNYGNLAGLQMFDYPWETFVQTPSRKSAGESEEEQSKRNVLVDSVMEVRKIDISGAMRQTSTGRRFRVKDGLYWAMTTLDGERLGDAAVIREWEYLDDASSTEEKVVDATAASENQPLPPAQVP